MSVKFSGYKVSTKLPFNCKNFDSPATVPTLIRWTSLHISFILFLTWREITNPIVQNVVRTRLSLRLLIYIIKKGQNSFCICYMVLAYSAMDEICRRRTVNVWKAYLLQTNSQEIAELFKQTWIRSKYVQYYKSFPLQSILWRFNFFGIYQRVFHCIAVSDHGYEDSRFYFADHLCD